MRKKVKVVNLETGMPTVEIASKRLGFEITTAKREGCIVLKLIHGYGSTGTGGKIKVAVRKLLTLKKSEGTIKAFVNGEDWSIFNQASRMILESCADLKQDSDLENYNEGITLVLL